MNHNSTRMYSLIEIKMGKQYFYYAGTKNGKVSMVPNPFYGKHYINKKSAENACAKLAVQNPDATVSVHDVDAHGTIH